jgi:hypothetical protein
MRKSRCFVPIVPMALAAALVGCGSSTSTGAGSTATPATSSSGATPTAAPVSLTCPTADAVNSGLGVTMGAPDSEPATDVPAGSTGVICTYAETGAVGAVVIVLVTGPVATSFFSRLEAGEQQSAASNGYTLATANVSGVGSQAAIVTVSKAGGPDENGIVAASSNSGLSVTVLPPTSETQLQSFASQLLG